MVTIWRVRWAIAATLSRTFTRSTSITIRITISSHDGSAPLEAQIRRLMPDVHAFGHTHLNMDATIDGVRYSFPGDWGILEADGSLTLLSMVAEGAIHNPAFRRDGLDAVYLIGGETKEVAPTAIRLRSGDVVVQGGRSRGYYHGVPRVLAIDYDEFVHVRAALSFAEAYAAARGACAGSVQLVRRNIGDATRDVGAAIHSQRTGQLLQLPPRA